MSLPLVQSTGRRKRAVARVRVREGSGKITVNKRTVEQSVGKYLGALDAATRNS